MSAAEFQLLRPQRPRMPLGGWVISCRCVAWRRSSRGSLRQQRTVRGRSIGLARRGSRPESQFEKPSAGTHATGLRERLRLHRGGDISYKPGGSQDWLLVRPFPPSAQRKHSLPERAALRSQCDPKMEPKTRFRLRGQGGPRSMRTHSGNVISTCCLLLPIAATLFFGVFGIPKFARLSASPNTDQRQFRVDWGSGVDRSPQSAETQPLRPIDRHPRSSAAPSVGTIPATDRDDRMRGTESQVRIAPSAAGISMVTSEPQPRQRTSQVRQEFLERPGSPPRVIPASHSRSTDVEPLQMTSTDVVRPNQSTNQQAATDTETWQAAVRRLNELGISRYRLDVGSGPGLYLFSCFFTPPNQPNFLRRFEAEAERPLDAVRNVLAQVEEWHAVAMTTHQSYALPALASARPQVRSMSDP